MDIKTLLKSIPDSEHFQPEGKEVATAYEEGVIDPTKALYALAYLLHLYNNKDK